MQDRNVAGKLNSLGNYFVNYYVLIFENNEQKSFFKREKYLFALKFDCHKYFS
jgi:hypothetical protein